MTHLPIRKFYKLQTAKLKHFQVAVTDGKVPPLPIKFMKRASFAFFKKTVPFLFPFYTNCLLPEVWEKRIGTGKVK